MEPPKLDAEVINLRPKQIQKLIQSPMFLAGCALAGLLVAVYLIKKNKGPARILHMAPRPAAPAPAPATFSSGMESIPGAKTGPASEMPVIDQPKSIMEFLPNGT